MTPEQQQIVKTLWDEDYSAKGLALGIFAFIVMLVTHNAFSGLIASVFLNTSFDDFGWPLTAKRDAEVSIDRGRYRVIQGMMQSVTAIVPMFTIGGTVLSHWHIYFGALGIHLAAGIAPLVAWQFYAQDKMFFVLQKLPDQGNYFWLRHWGVLWLWGKIKKSSADKPVTDRQLWSLFVTGLVIAAGFCMLASL